MKKSNYQIYAPEQAYSKTGPGYMSLNIEFLLKIQTNLKLNVIDLEGNSMIDGKQAVSDTEIHFIKVESILEKYEIKLSIIKQLF